MRSSGFLGTLPTTVFRAKGFIRLAESPEKVHTFQQVRDQAELILLPLESGEDLPSGLVFIGPNLDEKRIRELAQVARSRPRLMIQAHFFPTRRIWVRPKALLPILMALVAGLASAKPKPEPPPVPAFHPPEYFSRLTSTRITNSLAPRRAD